MILNVQKKSKDPDQLTQTKTEYLDPRIRDLRTLKKVFFFIHQNKTHFKICKEIKE
jgi:hypothetical protein